MSGEDDGLHRIVGLGAAGAIEQVDPHLVGHGVSPLWPVKGDDEQLTVHFGAYVLVIHVESAPLLCELYRSTRPRVPIVITICAAYVNWRLASFAKAPSMVMSSL